MGPLVVGWTLGREGEERENTTVEDIQDGAWETERRGKGCFFLPLIAPTNNKFNRKNRPCGADLMKVTGSSGRARVSSPTGPGRLSVKASKSDRASLWPAATFAAMLTPACAEYACVHVYLYMQVDSPVSLIHRSFGTSNCMTGLGFSWAVSRVQPCLCHRKGEGLRRNPGQEGSSSPRGLHLGMPHPAHSCGPSRHG